MPRFQVPWFYGWKICLISCFANFMIQGGSVYIMNALLQPFEEVYGWSRGDIGYALAFGAFWSMAGLPLLAALQPWFNLRAMMTGGALMGGLAFFLIGYSHSLLAFTALYTILCICGQICGGMIANTLISNWFVTKRGKAFGLANFGISLSGAVLPFAAMLLIRSFSLETASAVLGGITLLLVPLCWIYVRDTPESIDLLPDGKAARREEDSREGKERMAPAGENGEPERESSEWDLFYSWKALLHSSLIYRTGITFAILLAVSGGVMAQLKPRFSDIGFSDIQAMAFMSATAFFMAVGKYFWGWVSDLWHPIKTARALILCNMAGILLAFLPPTLTDMVLFSVIFGVAMGGAWTCLPIVVAHVFGRRHFMNAYSLASFFVILKALGFIVMGQSHELTGSYDAAYVCFFGAMAVGLFLLPGVNTTYRPDRG